MATTVYTPEQIAAIREAIESPAFHHARQKRLVMSEVVTIYHRDHSSPSGVIAAAWGSPDVVNPMLREIRNNSPLSPTEDLCAPSRSRCI